MDKGKDESKEKGRFRIALFRPFQFFVREESASGLFLAVAAISAFAWSNSPFAGSYHHLWELRVAFSLGEFSVARSIREWINEGLMAVFFFVVGLEIKRELLVGELSSKKKAALPAGAALGGMMFPAFTYLLFNRSAQSAVGWGIPVATDIAFALGALLALGKRVPFGIRIFLSALAIVDDLGAVVVIAVFYTRELFVSYLILGAGFFSLILLANLLWIRNAVVYAGLGILLWLSFLGSGLHATIAGVIVALCIPARGKYDTDMFVGEVNKYVRDLECPAERCGFSVMVNRKHLDAVQAIELACHHVETPLQRMERWLHPWVAFLIVPLFAIANAGITLADVNIKEAVISPILPGITSGLLIGKPLWIFLFSWFLVKMNMASLPAGVRWRHILGAGILGGIGFTMSLFITNLSFPASPSADYAKVAVFLGSLSSAVFGILFLFAVSGGQRAEKYHRKQKK